MTSSTNRPRDACCFEGRSQVQVPLYFAAPVEKRHGTKSFRIQNTRAHLLISASPCEISREKVPVRNQFEKRTSVEIGRGVMLALPSVVSDWKPA
jgi:hypothetical protein